MAASRRLDHSGESLAFDRVLDPHSPHVTQHHGVAAGVDHKPPRARLLQELQERVEGSRAEPASVQPLTVVGSYRLF
jgi:hypothetical protein